MNINEFIFTGCELRLSVNVVRIHGTRFVLFFKFLRCLCLCVRECDRTVLLTHAWYYSTCTCISDPFPSVSKRAAVL